MCFVLERGGGWGVDEVMAEVAQLCSQETKAINLRASAYSRASPHLSEDMRDRQQPATAHLTQQPALSTLLTS